MGAGGPGAFAAREFRKKLGSLRDLFGVNAKALFFADITSEFKDEAYIYVLAYNICWEVIF